MHEVYLWPFQNAVKAGVASFMCSYNRINSSYGCQNSKTLNGILKDELGFQGYVRADTIAYCFETELTDTKGYVRLGSNTLRMAGRRSR